MTLITEEDKEMAAKAVWMTAFQTTLEACQKMNLGPSATMVGMVTTMTSIIRMLFDDIRKEDN